jgi:hypothetical protein
VDREAIRAFVERPWRTLEALKRAHHARRFRERGAAAGLEAGAALWQHARRVRPDWPTAAERTADLAHHVDQKRHLDRAARAFTRR